MSKIAILYVVLIAAFLTSITSVQAFIPGPVIVSVTITTSSSTYPFTFVIKGSDFGTGPVTVPANKGWTGFDTTYGGSAPSLGIGDVTQSWNAANDYCSGTCSVTVHGFGLGGYNDIGVTSLRWTNNLIQVTCCGSAVTGNPFPLHTGDTLLIVVFNAGTYGYYVIHYTGPSEG